MGIGLGRASLISHLLDQHAPKGPFSSSLRESHPKADESAWHCNQRPISLICNLLNFDHQSPYQPLLHH